MDTVWRVVLWTAVGAVGLVMAVTWRRAGRPLTGWLRSGVGGVCALLAVDAAGIFTGVSLGFGVLSLGTSVLLGIPGVVMLLLLQCILR